MIQKLSVAILVTWSTLALCSQLPAQTTSSDAGEQNSERTLVDVESEQLPILFDFRWATNVHRYFDARDLGDKKAMAAELKAWSAVEKKITATDRAERTQLIKLLENSKLTDELLDQFFQQPATMSWSLLLALEQIDTRRGRPSKPFRIKLEETLRIRCESIIDRYRENSFSRNALSLYTCQTAARLSDDSQAVLLIERATNEINGRRHEPDLQLLSLQTERLLRLVHRSITNKKRALQSCRAFCQLLQEEDAQEYLKAYPLALAKAHYTLARLQANAQEQFDELPAALRACDKMSLDNDSISERWVWEAKRELKRSNGLIPVEQVQQLFRYRQEKLRASMLLDGYHLLASKSAKAGPTVSRADAQRFNAEVVATSLRELDKLQENVRVSPDEQLVTRQSLATILRVLNDPASSDMRDRAMEVAWGLRGKELDVSLRKIVLNCQVEWIELRVNGMRVSAGSESRLPEVEQVIDEVKKDTTLEKNKELAARFKRAELFFHLSGGNADFTQQLLTELMKQQQSVETSLLIPSLRLLLAVQTGDLRVANEIRDKELKDVVSSTKSEHGLPLYALAELENASGFNSITSTLCLHNVLKKDHSVSQLNQRSVSQTLWLGNALQLASSAAHFQTQKGISSENREQLDRAVRAVAAGFGTDSPDADYRRVLMCLAELDPANSDLGSFRVRAIIALAVEELQNVKGRVASLRQANQEAWKKIYEKQKEDLRVSEVQLASAREEFNSTFEKAEELLKQPNRTRQQYAAIEVEHKTAKAKLNELQAKVDVERAKIVDAYDGLFRIATSPLPVINEQTNLAKYSRQLESFLRTADRPRKLSSILFNARCLVLESALLLGFDKVGCTPETLDGYAVRVAQDALQLRRNWSGWNGWNDNPSTENDERTWASRNILFDKYQLGFELAVRWSAVHQDHRKSVHFAALTTNRSLAELQQSTGDTRDVAELSSENEPGQLDLPANFIAYFSGNESLHVFWQFGGRGVKQAESFVNRATLDAMVQSLLEKYKNAESIGIEVEQRLLAGWLLPKELCGDLLAHTKVVKKPQCVYVAPHGPLFQIPLEGLPVLGADSQRSLGEIQPLIYLPTLISGDRRAAGSEPVSYSQKVLTIQPGTDVGSESNRLVCTFGSELSVQLGPRETNKKTVVEKLEQVRWEIVHFGAHAEKDSTKTAGLTSDEVDTSDQANTSVEAATSREARDARESTDAFIDLKPEILTTGDLRKLKIRVKHVLLSVCEAQAVNASDLKNGGNTLKTLGTTFLAIGAEDVIASHWAATDKSTTVLFSQLITEYAAARNSDSSTEISTEQLAELLFQARQRVRAETSHPCFWNVFTIWTLR